MVLNLSLAAGIFATAWQARLSWQQTQAERRATLHVPVRKVTAPPPPAALKPDIPPATKYADVANKNLFTPDRNPTVVIEVPKPPEEKKMPSLPVVYGTMGLPSGTKAIMAEKAGAVSRSVRAGDSIGDFKVLALDTQKVTFEWDGKQIEKRVEDLIDRTGAKAGDGAAQGGSRAGNEGPAAAPPPPAQPLGEPKGPGSDLTPTMKDCSRGDSTPPGTVVGGYRKTLTATPFGPICRWLKE